MDGTPISLFSAVKAKFLPSGKVHKQKMQSVLGRMETAFVFPRTTADDSHATEVQIDLQFMGHYRESDLRFVHKVKNISLFRTRSYN